MADITFSMSADEKDVLRALNAVSREQGKLRDQINSLAGASREAGTADISLLQARMSGLSALIEKQKGLKTQQADLKQQLEDGKISAQEYSTAMAALAAESNDLTNAMAGLKTQINEDTADMKKAGTVIGQVEDKTERYARAVRELDRLKAKGIITSQQHAKAVELESAKLADTGVSADKSGGLISGLTTKLTGFVTGLASLAAITAMIRSEYDALLERQGKSRDSNISLAGQQEALLMNLGGADPDSVLKNIRDLSKQSGVKEEQITTAVNDAMAARGDLGVDQVVKAVGSVAKIRKLAPTEMAGLAAATIDTQKQTGLGTDASLGFLLQLQGQARTKNLKGLAENFTPSVGGMMQFGFDRQTAGATLAALSHGMGDTTGAMTGTAGIQFAKQLREFGKAESGFTGGPAMERQIAQLNAKHEAEKEALKSQFTARKDQLATSELSSADKTMKRRELEAAEAKSARDLKSRQEAELKAVAAAAPTLSASQVLEALQRDPALRAKFLAGKDQGGFGATFEAKALPAIESLLSGGTQAKQFASARQALTSDPMAALDAAIKARQASTAIGLAEADQNLGNVADQFKLNDTAGAQSAIVRDRMKEIDAALPSNTAMGNRIRSIARDVRTAGDQSLQTGIAELEQQIAQRKKGVSDTVMSGNIPPMMAFAAAKKSTQDPEFQKQTKVLEELLATMKSQLAQNEQKAHAGVVAARAREAGQ